MTAKELKQDLINGIKKYSEMMDNNRYTASELIAITQKISVLEIRLEREFDMTEEEIWEEVFA